MAFSTAQGVDSIPAPSTAATAATATAPLAATAGATAPLAAAKPASPASPSLVERVLLRLPGSAVTPATVSARLLLEARVATAAAADASELRNLLHAPRYHSEGFAALNEVRRSALLSGAAAALPARALQAATLEPSLLDIAPDGREAPELAALAFPLRISTGAFCGRGGEALLRCQVGALCCSRRGGAMAEAPPSSPTPSGKPLSSLPPGAPWRVSGLAELGAGITSFFKVLKTLAQLHVLLVLLYIPALVLNYWGAGGAPARALPPSTPWAPPRWGTLP